MLSLACPVEQVERLTLAREDYTFEKEGRANLFIAYEPLAGKRCLKVIEHRTKQDWALFMREVLEEQYPEASKVVVVVAASLISTVVTEIDIRVSSRSIL